MNRPIRCLALLAGMLLHQPMLQAEARFDQTAYTAEQKVVFDFFLDDPAKMGSALYWVRSYLNPLLDAPYGFASEFMDIKLLIHGTELVTLAKKNYGKYSDVVERLKYYHSLGVEVRVCALAMEDYDYRAKDLQDFVVMAPSAMTELAHWQQQGYALIRPIVMERHLRIEDIR